MSNGGCKEGQFFPLLNGRPLLRMNLGVGASYRGEKRKMQGASQCIVNVQSVLAIRALRYF